VVELQKVSVTCDEEVGVGGERTLEEDVVLRVATQVKFLLRGDHLCVSDERGDAGEEDLEL
jgi:hypothetical protein